jgi:hypothetical protein
LSHDILLAVVYTQIEAFCKCDDVVSFEFAVLIGAISLSYVTCRREWDRLISSRYLE